MRDRTPEKLTKKEKAFGVSLGIGASILTGVGVAVPTLEFIVAGGGGASGLGLAVTGAGAIATLALGGVVLALVGGVAAFMAYNSYAEIAKELKRDKENQKRNLEKAQEDLKAELHQYVMTMLRLYVLQNENKLEALHNEEAFKQFLQANLPVFLDKRNNVLQKATDNIKKLFTRVAGAESLNIVGKVTHHENDTYKQVLKSLLDRKPVHEDEVRNFTNGNAEIKSIINRFYESNFVEKIKPQPAKPLYILDGLLAGLAGFVGVLGTSTSISAVVLGAGISFGLLVSNPVGWGILGAAVGIGIVAGITYGYFQYKNAKRRAMVAASREHVTQLQEQTNAIKDKRVELDAQVLTLTGREQFKHDREAAEKDLAHAQELAREREERRKAEENAETHKAQHKASQAKVSDLEKELALQKMLTKSAMLAAVDAKAKTSPTHSRRNSMSGRMFVDSVKREEAAPAPAPIVVV